MASFFRKNRVSKFCAFLTLPLGTFVYANLILFLIETMDEDVKFKQMSTASRQGAFIYLHGRLREGELERGAMAEAARLFSVTHKAMALFWREMNKKIDDGNFDVEDVLANTLFLQEQV